MLKNRKGIAPLAILTFSIAGVLILGGGMYFLQKYLSGKGGTNKSATTDSTSTATPSGMSVLGIPPTSASVVTSPPSNMEGINNHVEVYGTGADPNIITLGPKLGTHPDWTPYPDKHGVEFELNHGTPLLAPIDMVLVGFSNNSAKYRVQDGQKFAPFNDLALFFESASPEWPGMIIKTYHLYSSPMLRGHYQNPDCSEGEEWGSTTQTKGRLYFEFNDSVITKKGNTDACEALIGQMVKRGELIGYAGSVGEHSMASFCFKVSDTSLNPTVKEGNRNLHWVQPDLFFYWKSYSAGAVFPSGVLAYPFESGGYQLPANQRDVNFKYAAM